MNTNVNEFVINLDRFGGLIGRTHEAMVKKIAFTALRGIVYKTPVDTGRCRANWSVVLGSPTSESTEETDPSGPSTIARGAAIINAANPSREIIWIQNNLPYAEALENGHSQQSPQGMVAVTLAEIRAGF